MSRIAIALLILCMSRISIAGTPEVNQDLKNSEFCSKTARTYMSQPDVKAEKKFVDSLSYTSHYNKGMNKCLIKKTSHMVYKDKGEVLELSHIIDALDGKVLGGKGITKKLEIGSSPKTIGIMVIKDENIIKDPNQAAEVLQWLDNLMEN